jgi:ABC-type glycerol-3-phosphate transport system permease component
MKQMLVRPAARREGVARRRLFAQPGRRHLRRLIVLVSVLVIVGFNLFPVYQMVAISFEPLNTLIQSQFHFLPVQVTLSNYQTISSQGQQFIIYFTNSTINGLAATLLSTALSALGGYSLARYRYMGKWLIEHGILLIYIVPPILLVVPFYVIMVRLHLLDTRLGVILGHTLFSVPFGTWLLRGFFLSLPVATEESAAIDGANLIQILRHVVVPVSLPGLGAVALFAFVQSWDEFLFSSVLIQSQSNKTVPVGIYSMMGGYGEVDWGAIMAASTLGAIPMLLVFLFLQRWMVQGLSAGAVKG